MSRVEARRGDARRRPTAAGARPTSGVMPILTPAGKTGSAANAGLKAEISRAIAKIGRMSIMKGLLGLH